MDDSTRGTGRSTRQMQAAPIGAHVVVLHQIHVAYSRRLAERIGREDLKIVPLTFLDDNRWRGLKFAGLIVDHACFEYPAIGEREAEQRYRRRLAIDWIRRVEVGK